MNLSDPIERLALVGPTYAKRLEKLEIFTIEDLLYHLPFRYDDFSLISPIDRVQAGETVTITGKVDQIENAYTKSGRKIQKAVISDNSGKIQAIWFNQPFLTRTIKIGENYNFSGKCDWFGREKAFITPEYELQTSATTIHTGRLVPIYPETYGVSSKWLRSRIKTALEIFGNRRQEFLPSEIITKENLITETEALSQIHFPTYINSAEKARNRLAFDEFFLIQLAAILRKSQWQKKTLGKKLFIDQEKIAGFVKKLPFELTGAQKRCVDEILDDMRQAVPMNRLLEGDVGSGKTIVATVAAYAAYLNGYQTVYMAPTEILANQHYSTFKNLLEPLGVPIELITANHKEISNFKFQISKITIGTHALLYQEFDSKKVGLVIVDEQHRFGVEQRMILSQKGDCPHFLTMTATPIPRTIALVLFGDLELSVIDEMPKGRIPVKTWMVPREKRTAGYEWIREKIKDTPQQAFVICPLIEESETLRDVKAVTEEFKILSGKIFPDLRLGLLHGRVKSKEKDKIMQEFKMGKIDILVSTALVEVGIDIPNATIMVIEAADRFGLAQLHQLRGRVGRDKFQSYCFLFTENQEPKVIERLKTLEKTSLGTQLAEEDLRLRGPGEIYGTRQHGFPDLKAASFTDLPLIQKTREAAEQTFNKFQLSSPLIKRLEKYKIGPVRN